MKKIIALIALLGAASSFADTFGMDSYLYWMIGDTGSFTWTTAKASIGGGEYLTIANGGLTTGSDSMTKGVATDYFSNWAALTGVDNARSMIIELYNNEVCVAESDALSLSAAAQYIVDNRMTTVFANPYTFGNFHIPEPNSAMLMLVGAALLGLKRKRAKKA